MKGKERKGKAERKGKKRRGSLFFNFFKENAPTLDYYSSGSSINEFYGGVDLNQVYQDSGKKKTEKRKRKGWKEQKKEKKKNEESEKNKNED